ncbi:MAG: metallophosphoesterase [Ktedonobacterales bacterium]
MRDVTGKREQDVPRLRSLGILPADDQPPFDIIGDVHGCIDELRSLMDRLGYSRSGAGYVHPTGRRAVFVGDLVDRGPGSVPVMEIVLAMHAGGEALLVLGNHDARLLRWLRGRNVRIAYGLAQTIAELQALPEPSFIALRGSIGELFEAAPGYLILDGGRLVVTHGGIRDRMIGGWDGETASYCLYGEVEGYSPSGKPLRRDWAAHRHTSVGALEWRGTPDAGEASEGHLESGPQPAPFIIYGHNVVSELRWVHRTLDLDTGCVYGGWLSALRYPELEEVQVHALRTYAHRRS